MTPSLNQDWRRSHLHLTKEETEACMKRTAGEPLPGCCALLPTQAITDSGEE